MTETLAWFVMVNFYNEDEKVRGLLTEHGYDQCGEKEDGVVPEPTGGPLWKDDWTANMGLAKRFTNLDDATWISGFWNGAQPITIEEAADKLP